MDAGGQDKGLRRVYPATAILLTIAAVATVLILSVLTADQRPLAFPLLVSLNVFFAFIGRFLVTETQLPLYNIGVFAAAMMLLYTIIPPLWLLLSGISYTPLSDSQMFYYQPEPTLYARVVWRYVAFLATFCAGYAILAPRNAVLGARVERVPRPLFISLVILTLTVAVSIFLIEISFGVDLNPEYNSAVDENYQRLLGLPLIVRQLAAQLLRFALILKLAFVLIAVSNWSSGVWRFALLSWIGLTIASNVIFAGARTELFLILLAFFLAFHRFVRPISMRAAAAGGLLLLTGFLYLGVYRTTATYAALSDVSLSELSSIIFALPTEFSTVFAGNFDLYMMKTNHLLPEVPWTILAFEPLMLLPQQIVPFVKEDPQAWYLAASPAPFGYFMYGPIAQSILGLDWVELMLRAGILATILAGFHWLLLKYQENFWFNLLYLFVLLFSYTAIRSTTFGFVYLAAFGFVPLLASAYILQRILRQASLGAVAAQQTFRWRQGRIIPKGAA